MEFRFAKRKCRCEQLRVWMNKRLAKAHKVSDLDKDNTYQAHKTEFENLNCNKMVNR